MLQYLSRANRGPLTADGLREIYTELLDLTKREIARRGRRPGLGLGALFRVRGELVGRNGVEEGTKLVRVELRQGRDPGGGRDLVVGGIPSNSTPDSSITSSAT